MFHHVDLLTIYYQKLKNRVIMRLLAIDTGTISSCRNLGGGE